MSDLAGWLEEAKRRGLIGPEPLDRTLTHARALGEVAIQSGPPASAYLDLGSGGGVPGLILASDWPASAWVLMDSNQRSVEFLGEAVRALQLADRVTVSDKRAEIAGRETIHRERYGLVTVRAVAGPAVTAEYAAPLLCLGGLAVVSEPPGAVPDRWDPTGLAGLGLTLEARRAEPVTVAVLRKTGALAERFPRRTGVARKRPLWR